MHVYIEQASVQPHDYEGKHENKLLEIRPMFPISQGVHKLAQQNLLINSTQTLQNGIPLLNVFFTKVNRNHPSWTVTM